MITQIIFKLLARSSLVLYIASTSKLTERITVAAHNFYLPEDIGEILARYFSLCNS